MRFQNEDCHETWVELDRYRICIETLDTRIVLLPEEVEPVIGLLRQALEERARSLGSIPKD